MPDKGLSMLDSECVVPKCNQVQSVRAEELPEAVAAAPREPGGKC